MSDLRSLAQSTVEEISETDYPRISHSESLSRLISFFHTSKSYEALVTDVHPPRLVSVRDILKVTHPRRTSVSKIAFRPPSISPSTPIHDASLKLVRNRIRILPIIENESVIGVARQSKILEKMADCYDLREFVAEDLMVEKLVTVSRESSMGTVRSIMLREGISHAPVVDKDGRLKGIITARDLVWHYVKPRESMRVGERTGEKIRLFEMGIKGLTDKTPLRVTRRTAMFDVVSEMATRKKGYSLVVEKRKPIGIITPRDVISLLTEFRPRIQIPVYMVGFKDQEEVLVQSAKKKIARVARRGLKIHPGIQEIVVHGKVSSMTGQRKRFMVKARAYTPSVLAVTVKGWALLKVFDELSEKLDRRLRKK